MRRQTEDIEDNEDGASEHLEDLEGDEEAQSRGLRTSSPPPVSTLAWNETHEQLFVQSKSRILLVYSASLACDHEAT